MNNSPIHKKRTLIWEIIVEQPVQKFSSITSPIISFGGSLSPFHRLKPVSGSEYLLSMLGGRNDKHYIIATQDRDL